MTDVEMLKAILVGRLQARDGRLDGVDLEELLEGVDADDQCAAGAIDELEAEGLITKARDRGGDVVQLSERGIAYGGALVTRRGDRAARRVACRNGLLLWLRQCTSSTRGQDVQRFMPAPLARFACDVFTVDEIIEAATYLFAKGLICKGFTSYGLGGQFVDAKTTDTGIDCADDFGGDVSGYLQHVSGAAAGIGALSVGGTGNTVQVQNHSPAARQQAAPTQTFSHVRAWADQVEQALPEARLTQADLDDIRDQLTQLRAELTEPSPQPGRLRTLGRAILRILAVAETSAAVAAAIAVAASLFS